MAPCQALFGVGRKFTVALTLFHEASGIEKPRQAWWIAYGPFVGMFVTRISRGRSIRQVILGMLGNGSLGAGGSSANPYRVFTCDLRRGSDGGVTGQAIACWSRLISAYSGLRNFSVNRSVLPVTVLRPTS